MDKAMKDNVISISIKAKKVGIDISKRPILHSLLDLIY
jgi:hypothetical protein